MSDPLNPFPGNLRQHQVKPTEKDLEVYLDRLRAKDPLWREREELGLMLMKHIDDLTTEDRKRYDELLKILTP